MIFRVGLWGWPVIFVTKGRGRGKGSEFFETEGGGGEKFHDEIVLHQPQPHKCLWTVPRFIQIGVRESLIPWICSFISGRQQCSRYNQTLSDYKKLNGGMMFFDLWNKPSVSIATEEFKYERGHPLSWLRCWSLMMFEPLVPMDTSRHFQLFRKDLPHCFKMFSCVRSQIICNA